MNKGGVSETQAVGAFVEVREISKLYGYNVLSAQLYYYLRRTKQYVYKLIGWR